MRMTDCAAASGDHQSRCSEVPRSSSSSQLTESSAIATHHRYASAAQVKRRSFLDKLSLDHCGWKSKDPLSSASDPVCSEWDRSGLRPVALESVETKAMGEWRGVEHSPTNDGYKTGIVGDLERDTPPPDNEGRGSDNSRQTKEGGDGGAEGGTGPETSYSSCLEGGSSSSSQVTWWSVTDASISAMEQEKKRVSFGERSLPCDADKKSLLHKRSILKASALRGGDGGGEERTGAGHGGWTERDLEAEKIVNSAALTKKRLRKRWMNSPSSTQHRQSPGLLLLSGQLPTPRRHHSPSVSARDDGSVGQRRNDLPAAAAGCRATHPTDCYRPGSRRGQRPQTPPPQRRRHCQSRGGGIVNESYREDDEDKEEDEETDNRRNAERLMRGAAEGGEGQEGGRGGGGWKDDSTCYLVHLRDTDRIPKQVDHIIRKFHLRLVEPQNTSGSNNIVDMETASSAAMTELKPQQQAPMGATSITAKRNETEEKSSMSTSCLEHETSKTRSLSLRRRLSLRFSKKTGGLDKSRSVPGPSTVGQAGGCSGGSSMEETAMSLGSMKRQTTSGVEKSKDTESCGAAGSSDDQAKTSGSVASDAIYRAQKKVPLWRKLSMHVFRKSGDRATEAQHPQSELHEEEKSKEREESRDAMSREKNDGAWTTQQSPSSSSAAAAAETSEGRGQMMTNAKKTSSETSKVLTSSSHPLTLTPTPGEGSETTEAETLLSRPGDTRTSARAKAESNRELTLQQRPTSQSSWTMTTTQTSSSDVIVPLMAKTSHVFQDAVFYFGSQEKDDDDDGGGGGTRDRLLGSGRGGTLTGASMAKSEGRVPKPSKSSSLRLPLKGAISETRDEDELRERRSRSHLERRRSSLLLRRVRAFFGRSSGSAEEQEEVAEERKMTSEDLEMMTMQDIEMGSQNRTSTSLHPTAPAPAPLQIQESIPLLQEVPSYPPPPPPPTPRKHPTTLTSARRQSSSENQLP